MLNAADCTLVARLWFWDLAYLGLFFGFVVVLGFFWWYPLLFGVVVLSLVCLVIMRFS
jgi:hypothetical protein